MMEFSPTLTGQYGGYFNTIRCLNNEMIKKLTFDQTKSVKRGRRIHIQPTVAVY